MHWTHLLGYVILAVFLVLFVWDIFQTESSILRTYPLIGYFRFIAESLGVYFRQFFYSNDREELPFNRAERTWVYEASKNADTTIGFGSTRDSKPIGTVYFV